jgi:hypothetical protein
VVLLDKTCNRFCGIHSIDNRVPGKGGHGGWSGLGVVPSGGDIVSGAWGNGAGHEPRGGRWEADSGNVGGGLVVGEVDNGRLGVVGKL